jgi:superfamily I DNA/RNA helicase
MTYPNPHQQQVIDHLHGPLLVLAPAGTGNIREPFDFFRR